MTDRHPFDFSEAAFHLAVANTPLFLHRKLREDQTVQKLSHQLDAGELVKRMQAALKKKPKNYDDDVAPYVYLTALSMKGDVSNLEQATKKLSPHHRWFQYLAKTLFDQTMPTSTLNVHAHGSLPSTVVERANDSATQMKTLITRD